MEKICVVCVITILLLSCASESQTDTPADETMTDADVVLTDYEGNDAETDADNESGEFVSGPYGHEYGDTAGDFTFEIGEGTSFRFSEQRSEDYIYVFIFNRQGSSQASSLWESTIYDMLKESPQNVYYFFLTPATGSTLDEQRKAFEERLDMSIRVVNNSSYWREHVFFVNTSVAEMETWIQEWYSSHGSDYVFMIDRSQRIRRVGLLHSWKTQTIDPVLKAVAYEPQYLNFEYERETHLTAENTDVTVDGIAGETFEDSRIIFEAEFPDAEEMDTFNTMEVDLRQQCDDPASCEWDRIMHLYIDNSGDGNCDTEIARWITSYGRSGRWVTDISEFLPMVRGGGTRKFRLYVWGDQYENFLSFRLSDSDSELKRVETVPLFSGNPGFNETYNDAYEQREVTIPTDVKKVELTAYVTGHGNGSEAENCAEFCAFEQVFIVNGTAFEKDHPEASVSNGCVEQISDGVIPNQYGTWPYGRAGWCPGLDVTPWTVDITDTVKNGESNVFNIEAYLDGEVYVPEVTNPDGYRAEINTSAYLVYYR